MKQYLIGLLLYCSLLFVCNLFYKWDTVSFGIGAGSLGVWILFDIIWEAIHEVKKLEAEDTEESSYLRTTSHIIEIQNKEKE